MTDVPDKQLLRKRYASAQRRSRLISALIAAAISAGLLGFALGFDFPHSDRIDGMLNDLAILAGCLLLWPFIVVMNAFEDDQ